MSEMPKPVYPDHIEKAPAGLFEHYCMHEGCHAWGSFGFERRYGQEWYCGEHKSDAGEKLASDFGLPRDFVISVFAANDCESPRCKAGLFKPPSMMTTFARKTSIQEKPPWT